MTVHSSFCDIRIHDFCSGDVQVRVMRDKCSLLQNYVRQDL